MTAIIGVIVVVIKVNEALKFSEWIAKSKWLDQNKSIAKKFIFK